MGLLRDLVLFAIGAVVATIIIAAGRWYLLYVRRRRVDELKSMPALDFCLLNEPTKKDEQPVPNHDLEKQELIECDIKQKEVLESSFSEKKQSRKETEQDVYQQELRRKNRKNRVPPPSPRSSRQYKDQLQTTLNKISKRWWDEYILDRSAFIWIHPTCVKEVEELQRTHTKNYTNPTINIAPMNFVDFSKAFVKTWDNEKRGDMIYAKKKIEQWQQTVRQNLLETLETRPFIGKYKDPKFSSPDNYPPFIGRPPQRLYDRSQLILDGSEHMISVINQVLSNTGLEVIHVQMYSQIMPTQEPINLSEEEIISGVLELMTKRSCIAEIESMGVPASLFLIRAFYLCCIPYRFIEVSVRRKNAPRIQDKTNQECRRVVEDELSWKSEDDYMEVEGSIRVEPNFNSYFRSFEANVYLNYFFDEIEHNTATKQNFLKEHGDYV